MKDIKLTKATIDDYPVIQNLGKFYEYDMSRYCGWPWKGEDGGYPSEHLINNFRTYFEEESRKAYLVLVDKEIAGFVLINKVGTSPDIDWNMGEFFILAKFQGKGIAKQVAKKIWFKYPGRWEVLVILENKPALCFWRKAISYITNKNYTEKIKYVDYDERQPKRYIFNFEINLKVEYAIDQDNEEIASIGVKCWRDSYQDIFPKKILDNLLVEDRVNRRIKAFNSPNIFSIVIRFQGKIIGFCDFGKSSHLEFAQWEIHSLYVLQEYRSFGVGELLIKYVIDYFRKNSFIPFIVVTLEANKRACKFYEKMGFYKISSIMSAISDELYPEVIYLFS